MKSITYNAGKFLLDGNEIVNTDLLKKHSGLQYGTGAPLEDGQKIPLPATLRAEVEYQCQYEETDGNCPNCFKRNLCRKVVRLVEVESKAEPSIKIKHDGPHQRLFSKPLPQPEKQAIDERVREIAGIAWKGAANAFRMYPNNSHTFASYWNGAKDQFKKFSLLEHHNTIASDGTQPPPQAESQEGVSKQSFMLMKASRNWNREKADKLESWLTRYRDDLKKSNVFHKNEAVIREIDELLNPKH